MRRAWRSRPRDLCSTRSRWPTRTRARWSRRCEPRPASRRASTSSGAWAHWTTSTSPTTRIAAAIAAFERSPELAPFTSKYDAYLAGKARLAAAELRGLKLFEDEKKGNCAACHPSRRSQDGRPPLFTDFTYDNLGVPRHPGNPFYTQAKEHNPAGSGYVDLGLGAVVNKPSEHGKFKVPTLRNVDLTAPYMHNGYFTTLRAVVEFYNDRDVRRRCKSEATEAEAQQARCWPAPEVAANVNRDEMGRLRLNDREIDDIVAFMRTLTDGYEPAPARAGR